MGDEEILDVIVVGAGPAGLACAGEAAGAGLQVIVLERGDVAGGKNLSGGRLYLEPVKDLCADLLKDAPFERPVVSETVCLCDERSSLSFRLDQPTGNSVTVLRARLDKHLANRATAKGAMVLPQQRADELVMPAGRVTGVKVGPEVLKARVVVAADGVLSFLAQQAGLRPARETHTYAVGFKEIIQLDAAVIEDRFNLPKGQGAARLYMGAVTGGLPGGGFIYTNRDSLSVGLVVQLGAVRKWRSESHLFDLLEEFKQRSDIAPLLAGGQTAEYGAHLIPEGGFGALPSPGIPGLLLAGDAAGFVLNTGPVLRGMDLALTSGVLAGRSIVAGLKARQPETCLQIYRQALKQSFIMKQMRAHKKAPIVLSSDRLYRRLPEQMVNWATDFFRVGPKGSHPRMRQAFKGLRRSLGFRGLQDLWRLMRM
jgi:electron transfer flavoprotein-quinone oxidoreductase